jgi:hypothetical protein
VQEAGLHPSGSHYSVGFSIWKLRNWAGFLNNRDAFRESIVHGAFLTDAGPANEGTGCRDYDLYNNLDRMHTVSIG